MILLVYGGSASGKSAYAEERVLDLAQTMARETGIPSGLVYMAAMKPYGEEAEMRIRRHRAMRAGKGFTTIERYTDAGGLLMPLVFESNDQNDAMRSGPREAWESGSGDDPAVILLECLSNLTANECYDPDGYLAREWADPDLCSDVRAREAADWILLSLKTLSKRVPHLVIVTLDVFRDIHLPDPGSISEPGSKALGPEPADDGTELFMNCLGLVNQGLAQIADEIIEVVYSIPVTVKPAPAGIENTGQE